MRSPARGSGNLDVSIPCNRSTHGAHPPLATHLIPQTHPHPPRHTPVAVQPTGCAYGTRLRMQEPMRGSPNEFNRHDGHFGRVASQP